MLFNNLENPFDDIFVISLKRSHNRRIWIDKQIKNKLSNKYTIIDAIDSTDQVVKRLYRDGLVKKFPPCFRCGKDTCNCENNVLIESQVATFYSHMEVWKKIASTKDGLYLIIEDDLKFNWYFSFLRLIYYWIINGINKRNRNKPLLIRMAWALNDEHRLQFIRAKKECIRMSNPAYAINSHMANLLISNFKIIDTTVDIYVHKYMAPKYAAYTLFPPIAHDLSYSLGHVESLIRPRETRIATLLKTKNDQAKRELSKYQHIIEKANTYQLLVTGFPGNNIFRLQNIFNERGLELGKNQIQKDGLISWVFAVYDLDHPRNYKGYARSKYFSNFLQTIIIIEDPRTSVKSIIDEISQNHNSYEFIKKHILMNYEVDISIKKNLIEQASLIYIYWSKLLQELNDAALIIKQEENVQNAIENLKKHKLNIHSSNISEVNNDINHPNDHNTYKTLTKKEWLSTSKSLRASLNRESIKLGYEPIFDSTLTRVLSKSKTEK